MPPRTPHDDPVVQLWTSAALLQLSSARSPVECAALTQACERLRLALVEDGLDLPPALALCGAAGPCVAGSHGDGCYLPWPTARPA